MMHSPAYAEQQRDLFLELGKMRLNSYSLLTMLGNGLGKSECVGEVVHFLLTTNLYRRIYVVVAEM